MNTVRGFAPHRTSYRYRPSTRPGRGRGAGKVAFTGVMPEMSHWLASRRKRRPNGQHGQVVDRHRVRVLHTGAGVEEHDPLPTGQPAAGPQVSNGGEAGGALRAQQQTLSLGVRAKLRQDLGVVDGDGRTAGLRDRVKDQLIAQWSGHRDTERDSPRVDPWLGAAGAGLEGPNDRRAAARLDRDEPGIRPGHPTERAHLGDRLVDADESDATAGGIDDDI